jgi:hypothetical protein
VPHHRAVCDGWESQLLISRNPCVFAFVSAPTRITPLQPKNVCHSERSEEPPHLPLRLPVSSTQTKNRHFDRSYSRLCEQRSGGIRFSTDTLRLYHTLAAATCRQPIDPSTKEVLKK